MIQELADHLDCPFNSFASTKFRANFCESHACAVHALSKSRPLMRSSSLALMPFGKMWVSGCSMTGAETGPGVTRKMVAGLIGSAFAINDRIAQLWPIKEILPLVEAGGNRG
jgi:hypothetical protein